MSLRIIQGDALEQLRLLPSDSVHCVVTSPPYYGLRDYGTAQWEGGDVACDHFKDRAGGVRSSTLEGGKSTTNHQQEAAYGHTCGKCGARRIDQQLGLERTLDEFLERLVAVFEEVRRTLHPSGVCFVNMGDSYAANRGYQVPDTKWRDVGNSKPSEVPYGLKPKDRLLVPWRLAVALQQEGWWVRDVICWAKRAPMPESVTDRCTQSWEPIFMLTKSARYFWDAEAVKETSAEPDKQPYETQYKVNGERDGENSNKWSGLNKFVGQPTRNLRNVWLLSPEPYPDAHFATFPTEIPKRCILAGTSAKGVCPKCGEPWRRQVEKGPPAPEPNHRNPDKRLKPGQAGNADAGNMGFRASKLSGQEMNEWKSEHPDKTIGWSPGCACDGVDRRPVRSPLAERVGDDPSIETGRAGYNRPRHPEEGSRIITRYEQQQYAAQLRASPHIEAMRSEAGKAFQHYVRTDDSGARPIPDEILTSWLGRGWLVEVTVPPPSLEPVPATCLDPFLGSGTVAAVAMDLGRSAIGIELSADYVRLAQARCAAVTPGFAFA